MNERLHIMYYCIVGNFHGVQFLRTVDLYHFTGLIFTDERTHTHYILYNQAYFVGLILRLGDDP